MDIKQIKEMIKDFEKSNLTTFEIEYDDLKLKLSKNINTVEERTPTQKGKDENKYDEEKVVNRGYEVKSPLVGTFYASSNPNENPFFSVGQRVEKGQTLCIIEAMKIMNEITAPISGVIDSINIKNGAPVGFDQTIMVIV
jgi:acetyl-CoA carboxylase biotin carboxyl carrier protein